MIVIENLCKSFGTVSVLKDISIYIPKGKIYGLVGQSGVGKSTLLRCINGLEPFDSGNLIVDGVDVKLLDESGKRNFTKNIGMIFQNFSLLQRMSVSENIALPMKCWKYSKKDIDMRVKELLELVEMPEKAHARPKELSGGQKQRVAIARALALNPKILLCDEATSALDPKIAKSIIQLLRRINGELGITIIVVTHQMEVLRSCCEEITILENGVVAISGSVTKIFAEQPHVLTNLIGEKQVPVIEGMTVLRVLLSDGSQAGILLSKMTKDLDIEVNFLGGEMDTYCDHLLGTSIIGVRNKDCPQVEQYLSEHHLTYSVLNNG